MEKDKAREDNPFDIHRGGDSGIVLTGQQLGILLQSMGTWEIEGICVPMERATDEETVLLIHTMVRQGILEVRENRFAIEKTLGEMLVCMVTASQKFPLEFSDGQFFFCYPKDDSILLTSLYQRKRNALKLTMMNKIEYGEWKEEMFRDIGRNRGAGDGEDL